MKFMADANLGKLVKWLRILGYDTVVYRGVPGRDFLRKGEREGRIILTRKKNMASRQFAGKLIVVASDRVQEQLAEVMDRLSISPDPDLIFKRCVKCNEVLETVERGEVEGAVPAFVYDTQGFFHRCPVCKGIFWSGTHVENTLNFLKTHIQRHHHESSQ
ncbi:MAG TPA: Mut7-C RNAse domain-containing protein [Syntrophales bacterium]|nr:Mut7-C RNAse domain-containing protein [Syntrophales bacterium]